MHSLKKIQLKCNKQFILNFDGGEPSDGGLLMIKEFLHALGVEKLLKNSFQTNDPALSCIHKDDENLLQMLYQIFGTYYEDNCADEQYGQMVHMYTFIVTNMEELGHWQVIGYYCNRGRMENFIGEGKQGFDFAAVSSRSRTVNANRLQLHALAYSIFNWFRRLALPGHMPLSA